MTIADYNLKLQTIVNWYATGVIEYEEMKEQVEQLNNDYWKANPKDNPNDDTMEEQQWE